MLLLTVNFVLQKEKERAGLPRPIVIMMPLFLLLMPNISPLPSYLEYVENRRIERTFFLFFESFSFFGKNFCHFCVCCREKNLVSKEIYQQYQMKGCFIKKHVSCLVFFHFFMWWRGRKILVSVVVGFFWETNFRRTISHSRTYYWITYLIPYFSLAIK